MTRTLRSVVFLSCGIMVMLGAFQISGCTQVDRLKASVEDNIAYERGNQALADDKQAEAAAQYRIAADAGHPEAQYKLGLLTATGKGVPKNKVEAFKLMRMSAEQGHAPAQDLLGTWYLAGTIAPQNSAEAARWFGKAAAQKDAAAMYYLGAMYARGEGVEKDHNTALGWFRQAAASGFPVPAEYLTMAGMAVLEKRAQGSQPKPIQASAPAATNWQSLVRDIQAGLSALGYKPGPADGLMGKKTTNAIKAFQRDVDMPADGKVSDALMRRIDEKLAN